MEFIITITMEMVRVYFMVVGIVLHLFGVGWLISKALRKIESLRSKSDMDTK